MGPVNRFEHVSELGKRAETRAYTELVRQLDASELVFRCNKDRDGWAVHSDRYLSDTINVKPRAAQGMIQFSMSLGAVIDERNAAALLALANYYSAHAFKIAEFWAETPGGAEPANGTEDHGWIPGNVVHMGFVRALGDESPTVSVYRLASSAEDVVDAFAAVAAGRLGPCEAVKKCRD